MHRRQTTTLAAVAIAAISAALLPAGATASRATGIRPDAPQVKRLQRVLNTIGYRQLGSSYGCYAIIGAITRPVLYLNVTDAAALPKARALLRRYDKSGIARAQLAADPAGSAQRREQVFREIKARLTATAFASRITVRLQRNIGGGAGMPATSCPPVSLATNDFRPDDTDEASADARAWLAAQKAEFGDLLSVGPTAMAV